MSAVECVSAEVEASCSAENDPLLTKASSEHPHRRIWRCAQLSDIQEVRNLSASLIVGTNVMQYRAVVTDVVYQLITRVVLRLVPRAIAEALATIFGLWTAILPLLIWAAWSADVLYAVLLSGAVSTTLYAIFAIATAPNVSKSDLIEWKQRRARYENKHAVPRKSTWRDIA